MVGGLGYICDRRVPVRVDMDCSGRERDPALSMKVSSLMSRQKSRPYKGLTHRLTIEWVAERSLSHGPEIRDGLISTFH
jgi:hypothetical protein